MSTTLAEIYSFLFHSPIDFEEYLCFVKEKKDHCSEAVMASSSMKSYVGMYSYVFV